MKTLLKFASKIEKDRNGDYFVLVEAIYLDENNVKYKKECSNTFADHNEALDFMAEQNALVLLSLGVKL